MKILLVHNYYGSAAPSGENRIFDAETDMLRKHGHLVSVYARYSDEIRTGGCLAQFYGKMKGAICTIGNPCAARDVAKKCCEFRPDVVHFHNTFPLVSPLAVRAASKFAPVVMTLHNYRVACSAGVPTHDGQVCSLCLNEQSVWPGIRRCCYRGSLWATLPLALSIALYRNRLTRWVTRFVTLSEFQRQKMVEYGWPKAKLVVKGNFIDCIEPGRIGAKKNQLVYVGRLSREKGVITLLKAFAQIGIGGLKLIVVGDGVDRRELEVMANGSNVEFVGQKSAVETKRIVSESKALVLPSTCWETFGLAAIEAMSVGVPPIVANVGALPDIVHGGEFGEIFEAGNPRACAAAIHRLLSRSDYDNMCVAVKREALTKYSEHENYKCLMNIYDNIVPH